MKRFSVFAVAGIAGISFLLSGAEGRALNPPFKRGADALLIVPARPAVLQLAFDFVKMRAVTLVSFRGKPGSDNPLLHVWTGSAWQYVSLDDFRALRFIAPPPKPAFIFGDDQTVPKILLQDMGWPCRVERLPTLNPADLINGMDKYFQFSSREWKRLADSYGLRLEDVNAPKRSFNPYDVPRSKLPLETREFKQGRDDPPPAVMIEKSGDQTKSKDNKPTEKPWIK